MNNKVLLSFLTITISAYGVNPISILKDQNNKKKVKTDKEVGFNLCLNANIPDTHTPSSVDFQNEFPNMYRPATCDEKTGKLKSFTKRKLGKDIEALEWLSQQTNKSPASKIYVKNIKDLTEQLEANDESYVLQGLIVREREREVDFILECATFTENSKTLQLYCVTPRVLHLYETPFTKAYWEITQTGEDEPVVTYYIKNMLAATIMTHKKSITLCALATSAFALYKYFR